VVIKRILVAVDFSTDSLNALAYACDLARRVQAEIVLVHVVETTYVVQGSNLYAANQELAKLVDDQWHIGNTELARLGAGLEQDGLRARIIVTSGVTGRTIVDMATRSSAQLIVMGTHGCTGLRHLLIGSVAEKVVRTGTCPVLTVRHAPAKQTTPDRRRSGFDEPRLRQQSRGVARTAGRPIATEKSAGQRET
jgi:nucleotide-binding universal stress UspA family protein